MDGIHLESYHGLYQNQPGMQALLCGTIVEEIAGDGATQLCKRFSCNLARTGIGIAAEMETTANNFRELNERSVPSKRSLGVH